MKHVRLTAIFILALLFVPVEFSSGQLLKKIQQRAEDEIVNEIFDKKEDNSASNPQPVSGQSNQSSGSGNNISNTRGGGLTSTPPDVVENIHGATSAFGQENFSGARYSIRQAILGIEMEIGQNILDELPQSVKGLNSVAGEDKVSSMSIGFVGLTIERTYHGGDQQFKVTVGNDAALLSAASMYMGSSAYATSSDQNHKQVQFQGYQGVLEYDEYSGYTLSVPFGQSSIYVANGVNFASEEEIMAAAGEIDIEKIKNELGEQ